MALTLKDIVDKLPPDKRVKLAKYAKKAFELGWKAHSNKLIAEKLLAHTKTLSRGQTKTRMVQMAAFILAHDELCYEDFIDYFDNVKGWYPDPEVHAEILKCFADSPVIKLYMKFGGHRY